MTLKEKKKSLRKSVRRVFKKDNIVKAVIIFATVILILTSILPYLL
ncbi:hypothetical protein GYA37_02085 [candidate division WWE3 bacterium]|uniref:Oligopeptide transport permease C-like N-terminal domain-containing protein n=1 Tax=candidate division WWE3 bacterium TaxID=2053526 RepID=A0A7X9E6W8_UNCKA|nr:hypothetical protein [candidate division WWE3 bacterium]